MITQSDQDQIARSTATETPPAFTDEQLMTMIQAHRQVGLDLMHRRYCKLLKVVSMNALHNESDAEDVLQDVMVEVWERASSYNPLKGRPLSWIITIMRNRSIDRLRRRNTRSRGEDRFAGQSQQPGDGWTHVHEDILHLERRVELDRALASLPAAQQSAVKLAYYEQMSQREISACTGIPLGTIKTRLELAMKKLSSSLRGYGDLLSSERAFVPQR